MSKISKAVITLLSILIGVIMVGCPLISSGEQLIYKCAVNGKVVGYYDKPCEYISAMSGFNNFTETVMLDKHQQVFSKYVGENNNNKNAKNAKKTGKTRKVKKTKATKKIKQFESKIVGGRQLDKYTNPIDCDLYAAKCIAAKANIRMLNRLLKDPDIQFAEQHDRRQPTTVTTNKLNQYLHKYQLIKVEYCNR